MKNYLNYQSSEYDCGSVSITNGIRYLFDREEISPDILKCIMLYTMDTYNEQGQPCRHGTSAAAMRFVGSWLNQLAAVRSFPIQTQFLFGNDVTLSPDSEISQALLHGAAVVLRLFLEVPHYVLLTGISKDEVFFSTLIMRKKGLPNSTLNIMPRASGLFMTSQNVPTAQFLWNASTDFPTDTMSWVNFPAARRY